jgi:hypothetical protein
MRRSMLRLETSLVLGSSAALHNPRLFLELMATHVRELPR